MRIRSAISIISLCIIASAGYAQDPSFGQGFRYSYRILDERGIEWGVLASSQVHKDEGGYRAIEVYKAGADFLILRTDLPDDPLAHFAVPESVTMVQLEFHLKGKVRIFVLQATRQKTVLISESKLENVEAYQYILDQTFKDGGQLFFDFMNCGERVRKGDPANGTGAKKEPNMDAASGDLEGFTAELEKLCFQRFTFIETDIPCSEIEGAVGLSCKEIEDAIFCPKSWQSFMKAYREGKFSESVGEATENFDRCSKDLLFFKFSMGFLLVSKNWKWYSTTFEEYLEKNKIDPLNYIHPKKPMYSDVCAALASYLFIKQKPKGFAALERECNYAGIDFQVLQLARDGDLDEVNISSKVRELELFKFLRAFLKGYEIPKELTIAKCDSANPRCHFRLALSRIATGKYDPTDFYEFYKYYPLFRDLVDEFSARREQAIKAIEKQKKESGSKPTLH